MRRFVWSIVVLSGVVTASPVVRASEIPMGAEDGAACEDALTNLRRRGRTILCARAKPPKVQATFNLLLNHVEAHLGHHVVVTELTLSLGEGTALLCAHLRGPVGHVDQ